MQRYKVHKKSGKTGGGFEVHADSYEIDMCGSVTFFQRRASDNGETGELKPILTTCPGSWGCIEELDPTVKQTPAAS